MLALFPDAVTWKCSVKRLFLKFSQFSQLWQLLASECRESSIAKISSLDKQSSWIHLWYYHSSTVKLLHDNIYTPFLSAWVHISHIYNILLLPGLPYPTTTLFLFCFIDLIIFLKNWLLRRISFRLRLKTLYCYRTIIYFIRIWLFSWIFYSFTQDSLQDVIIKILYFQ